MIKEKSFDCLYQEKGNLIMRKSWKLHLYIHRMHLMKEKKIKAT